MKLQELHEGLGNLYPPLRTRSGKLITTNEASGTIGAEGLSVTVKTLFPASDLRRTELVVYAAKGGLDIRPAEPLGTPDAQRFAELLRERWTRDKPDEPLAPLRLAKDDRGRYCFHVGPAASGAAREETDPAKPAGKPELGTDPATPTAKRYTRDKENS